MDNRDNRSDLKLAGGFFFFLRRYRREKNGAAVLNFAQRSSRVLSLVRTFLRVIFE